LLTLSLTTTFEEDNQTALGLFVVSDGIGGHQAGELASRQAVQLIGTEIISRVFQKTMAAGRQTSTEKLATALRKAVEKANEHLYDRRKKLGNDMGATVTAVLIQNHKAIIANVGDSRTYLWRQSELQAITQDHSLVASLIAAGELAEEAIYTHEQKGVIYRSLGDKPQIAVDTFSLSLAAEDRLILCCDGVWETIRDEGIEEVLLLEADLQRACNEMVKRANYAGGADNISVIVILVDPIY
jgi:PPM family protein phosphatase